MKFSLEDVFEFLIDPSAARRRLVEVPDDEVIAAILGMPTHFASTFSGNFTAKLTVTETVVAADVPNVDVTDAAMKFSVGDSAAIASVTAVASMTKALSSGSGTIDLTSLTHRNVSGISFNGLKVKYVALQNPVSNGNPITIAKGATNGNALLGTAFTITLQPGDSYCAKLANSPSVDSSNKNLDLTGTGSQALSVLLAAG